MRAILDTNILIHRESSVVVHNDIGSLFNWLDRLGYEKLIHPISLEEINRHGDEKVRASFKAKLASYNIIKIPSKIAPEIQDIINKFDRDNNDRNDSLILNEVFSGKVDILITEDRKILRKSEELNISEKVYNIDSFLEKVFAENPDLIEYKVLSIKRVLFGNIDVKNFFFDSFRKDYRGFDDWFNRKSDELAYVCFNENDLLAFLYIKREDEREVYSDIIPNFSKKKRLKIGTFKIQFNGFKLGERFLKIVFDNAINQRVDEIYFTIFSNTVEQERLIELLTDFGFCYYCNKVNSYGDEKVYIRNMLPHYHTHDPRLSFPYASNNSRSFLIPIYPEYHTSLLPDSILNNESPKDFVEHYPHRNSITKVYISRSYFRNLVRGDILVFYRTGGFYKSVVTTIGVVQNVYKDIQDEISFIKLCRKKSVFSDEELSECWNYKSSKPFIIEFLYIYSFPKRPNMESLINNGIIKSMNSAPRGVERITNEQFRTILKLSESDPYIIVN